MPPWWIGQILFMFQGARDLIYIDFSDFFNTFHRKIYCDLIQIDLKCYFFLIRTNTFFIFFNFDRVIIIFFSSFLRHYTLYRKKR